MAKLASPSKSHPLTHFPLSAQGHLFRAMRKTRLISPDASWQDVRYSRGGRTDRGVSALGQVGLAGALSLGIVHDNVLGE